MIMIMIMIIIIIILILLLIIIILIRPFLCDRPSRRDCAPFSCSQSGVHPERQLSRRECEYDGAIAMDKKHMITWIWGSLLHQGFLSIEIFRIMGILTLLIGGRPSPLIGI
jgi:hypothetical protein